MVAITDKDRAKARKNYRAYSSVVATCGWTVEAVRAAVAQHEVGQFHSSALLCDAMGRDDRIVSALDTLILGVLRLPFAITSANDVEDIETAELCRTALWLVWRRAVTDDQLYEALRWLVMMGFVLVELFWNTDDPAHWVPERVHVWHPQFIAWDDVKKVFLLQTTEGPIEVDPLNLGGKWLLIAPGGERAWMRGAVRSLADDFVAHDDALRDWLRDSEKHGSGWLKAKIPTGSGDSADKDAFLESIANVGTEPVIECPFDDRGVGYDLSVMETGKDHAAGFERLLVRLDANINIRLLGQNASTENAGPYVAKGGLFAKVTLDRIDGVVGPLEQAFREHIARPFAAFNYGDERFAPIPDYDSEPPPDKAAQAQTMLTVAQAVSTLKLAGKEVDDTEISQRFGFTVRTSPTAAPAPLETEEVAA